MDRKIKWKEKKMEIKNNRKNEETYEEYSMLNLNYVVVAYFLLSNLESFI
jgi:hypothetical protein